MTMTCGEIILSLFLVVILMWIQLLNDKITRIQKTLFQMKYKISIPPADQKEK